MIKIYLKSYLRIEESSVVGIILTSGTNLFWTFASSSLILIDELLEYVVKKDRAEKLSKIEQGQTAAFLQEISEVVAGKKNAAMVLTLPSSALEQYDERSEKALSQLQKISGRVETNTGTT